MLVAMPSTAVPRRAPAARRARRLAGAIGAMAALGVGVAAAGPALGQVSSTTTKPVTTTAKPTSTTAKPTSTTYATTTTAAPTTTTTEPETTEAPALPRGAGAAPFPAGTVGTVPYADLPAERSMAAVYVTEGGDARSVPVAVQFRKPFELPRKPYRLSVIFGDPTGPQVRASLTTNGGPTPTGKVEKRAGDGAEWTFIATTTVAFDKSGLATITYPLEIAPKGVAWAEVEEGGSDDLTQTPYFAPDALVGKAVGGALVSANVGQAIGADGAVVGAPTGLPSPPLLEVDNQTVELSFASGAPSAIGDHQVTATVATVEVAPSFTDFAVVSDGIRVDRTTGAINLIDRTVQPPVDKSSAEGWLVQGLPSGSPGAPATVTFDLRAVLAGLGIDASAIDATTGVGLGVRQEYALDDGSTVVGAPVLATTQWFGANAPVPVASVTAPGSAPQGSLVDDQAGEGNRSIIVATVVAFIVLLAVLALLVRRRTRARDDAADVLQTMAHEAEVARTDQVQAIRTGTVPAVGSPAAADAPAAPDAIVVAPPALVTVEDLEAAGAGGSPVDDQPEPVAGVVAAAAAGPTDAASPAAAEPAEPSGPRDPGGALAALDAEFAELQARLSRLSGGSSAGAGDPAGDAGSGATGGGGVPDGGGPTS